MKYKLTKNSIEVCGKKLFQIQATVSFGNIEKGELGGYIEKEENLSQENNAWVYGNAQVYGKLKISLGYFFGMRYNKEEIKYKENEGAEIIYKGEAKFEEDEPVEVIQIGDQKYNKQEVEEALKDIKSL